jgi:hypothetical protein
VRRLDEFLISKRPYAVGLESLSTTRRETGDGRPHWYCRCAAVWYRRRSGVLVSVLGTLWDYQDQEPTTVLEFVERHTWNSCARCWTGTPKYRPAMTAGGPSSPRRHSGRAA